MAQLIDPAQPTREEVLEIKMNSLKAQLASQIATEMVKGVNDRLFGDLTASEMADYVSEVSIRTARLIVDAHRPNPRFVGMIQ